MPKLQTGEGDRVAQEKKEMKKMSLTKKIKQDCLTVDQFLGSSFFLRDTEVAQVKKMSSFFMFVIK